MKTLHGGLVCPFFVMLSLFQWWSKLAGVGAGCNRIRGFGGLTVLQSQFWPKYHYFPKSLSTWGHETAAIMDILCISHLVFGQLLAFHQLLHPSVQLLHRLLLRTHLGSGAKSLLPRGRNLSEKSPKLKIHTISSSLRILISLSHGVAAAGRAGR